MKPLSYYAACQAVINDLAAGEDYSIEDGYVQWDRTLSSVLSAGQGLCERMDDDDLEEIMINDDECMDLLLAAVRGSTTIDPTDIHLILGRNFIDKYEAEIVSAMAEYVADSVEETW